MLLVPCSGLVAAGDEADGSPSREGEEESLGKMVFCAPAVGFALLHLV